MRFTVMGGDLRIARLSILLALDGHDVSCFALDKEESHIVKASSPTEAVANTDCVILPLPAEQNGFLNAPLSSGVFSINDILESIRPGTLVCGGILSPELFALAQQLGLKLVDYYAREELVVKNAVSTAEGAIELIMHETAQTIWRSRVLVIGNGHVGRVLSGRLKAMGADVSVSARSYGDFAWIEAFGCKCLDTRSIEEHLGGFDIIVNTVPAMILTENRLAQVHRDALCVDLASKPGGIDFSAASRLGVSAIWALSLPGKVAPASAGAIIRDTIYNIVAETNGYQPG